MQQRRGLEEVQGQHNGPQEDIGMDQLPAHDVAELLVEDGVGAEEFVEGREELAVELDQLREQVEAALQACGGVASVHAVGDVLHQMRQQI